MTYIKTPLEYFDLIALKNKVPTEGQIGPLLTSLSHKPAVMIVMPELHEHSITVRCTRTKKHPVKCVLSFQGGEDCQWLVLFLQWFITMLIYFKLLFTF